MDFIPEQRELRRELPVVVGNVDYREFEERLERMDELLRDSGLERKFVEQQLAAWVRGAAGRVSVSVKEQRRRQRMYMQALRCTLARQLTEKEHRRFSRRLAESALLQWFCGVERLDTIRVPSKSTLQRYEKLVPEPVVRAVVNTLNGLACAEGGRKGQPLGLEEALGIDVCWADTTCVKAPIHFPVDWVLLRDAVRTLMKAVVLIRRQGLKQRMEEPEVFLRRMNRLAIEMTHSRRKAGSVKARKRVLRRMKRLSGVIRRHAERYVQVLKERWGETEWTEAQAQQVIRRMEGVLAKLPEAIRQAHERIIGGRLVANADKLLSLYEPDVHVIVRGKAQAEVEFGNTLLLGEQREGLIVDWKLLRDQSPGDPVLLEESLERLHGVFGCYPLGVGADRGFDRRATREHLEARDIFNGICARSVQRHNEQMQEEAFEAVQWRRGQTEGRIGIFQNDFLGRPLRNKGFESRELAVAWAVLAHNLWVLARLPRAETRQKKKAA